MKNFGSKCEFQRERTQALLKAYFRHLHNCKHLSMSDAFSTVVNMPATRFWVSAPRAAVVVAKISRGDKLLYMRPNRREMFFEIYRRVMALKKHHHDWSTPKLIEAVISQPAPKFYLAPGSARAMILKARKQWFAEKSKRLRGC